MNRCTVCHINFSTFFNFRAHVKRKHPDLLDILAPVKDIQSHSSLPCLECKKKFTNLGNLRLHVKRKHPGKLEEIAPVKKKTHVCPYCSENFQILKHLAAHKKTHTIRELKCPLCPYTGCRENLILHFKSDHSLNIENECHKFETFEDFESWKLKIEEESYSAFVKMYTKKTTKSTIMCYRCHRSGVFKKSGMNIRKLKKQGTNKIGGYCPARINIKIMENKKCEVNYCKSHVGHEQDLGHLFLSKYQKQKVAAKIAAKIPFEKILDEVRDSVSNSHLKRLHLLTRKDLYNIEQCFKLRGSSLRNANDASDGDNLLIENDDERTALINADAKTRLGMEKSLEEAKKEFILQCSDQINDISSFEELEAIQKIVAPMKSTIDALRYQKKHANLTFPSTSGTPSNKKVVSIKKEY